MTLLVLEFRVPEGDLTHALVALAPNIFNYFLSFVVLGVYWVGQHNQFHYIERTDRFLLWINLAFLLVVALVPFSTALLSRFLDDFLAHAVYGLNISLIGLIAYWHWSYATIHHRLTGHALTKSAIDAVKARILVAPLLSVVGTVAWFVHPFLSLAIFLAIPVYYIWPGHIDQYWRQPAIPHDDGHDDEIHDHTH
jgi:uncharacterized membrane protein